MISAPISTNDAERLAELYKYELLDTQYEEDFNNIVTLASKICNAPISLITLIDTNRQWFKAKTGMDSDETERRTSFCGHAILKEGMFEVSDALLDERFYDNPLVTGDPNIRFYAGIPLITKKGYKLGTLCVIDTVPRCLDEEQTFALTVLASQTMNLIELRLRNKELSHITETQNRIISIMAHDIRNPLLSLKTVLDMRESDMLSEEESKEMMPLLSQQIERTIDMVSNLVDWGKLQSSIKYLECKPVQIKEIADKCFSQLSLNALLKQNKLVNNIPNDCYILTDSNALEFIMRNLLSNANKFTENGIIKISCYQDEGKSYICISDTGVGISMVKLKTILKSNTNYYTRGTRNEAGSGIGLSLVREFIDKVDGQLFINSEEGKGTCVSFQL